MTVKRMDNVGIVVESLDAGTPPRTRSAICARCSPLLILRRRLKSFASSARASSVKWSSTKAPIASAMSVAPRDCSLGSPRSSRRGDAS